jgi:hypothetical protein
MQQILLLPQFTLPYAVLSRTDDCEAVLRTARHINEMTDRLTTSIHVPKNHKPVADRS